MTKILILLTRQSPTKVTFSKVSQFAQVPRSTLYYYFGNSQRAMMEEAIRFGMKKFVLLYQFDRPASYDSWDSFQQERLKEAIALVQHYPWAPSLYFKYRADLGPWGDLVREIEMKYCDRLAKAWAKFHGEEPDYKAVRLSGYLKLGFLWGLALDHEVWTPAAQSGSMQKVVKDFTRMITDVLKLRT